MSEAEPSTTRGQSTTDAPSSRTGSLPGPSPAATLGKGSCLRSVPETTARRPAARPWPSRRPRTATRSSLALRTLDADDDALAAVDPPRSYRASTPSAAGGFAQGAAPDVVADFAAHPGATKGINAGVAALNPNSARGPDISPRYARNSALPAAKGIDAGIAKGHKTGAPAASKKSAAKGAATGRGPQGATGSFGKGVKGASEIEDRSCHYWDGVTGQPISARRRRDAASREALNGIGLNPDGSTYIRDSDDDADDWTVGRPGARTDGDTPSGTTANRVRRPPWQAGEADW